MASKSPFTALSPDLLIAIAEVVRPRDLLALRLTCQTLSSAMLKVYLKTFFRERWHLYTYDSLQNLVDISSSRLGKEIMHIGIVVPNYIVKEELRSVTHARFLFEVEALEYHGMPLLKEIFSNLARVGATPSLQIRGWTPKDDREVRVGDRRVQLKTRYHHARADCDKASALFLSAIAMMHFPVRSLDLCFTSAFVYTTPSTSCLSDKALFAGTHGPFATLTQLRLLFQHFPEEKDGFAKLQTVFGSAQNLCSISLAGREDDTERELSKLVMFESALQLDKIEHVELRWLKVSASDLIRFLESKKSTIKTLMLCGILLEGEDHWPTIFRWIATHLTLDKAIIEQLQKHPHSTELSPLVCTMYGPEVVKEELLKLADQPEF